MLDNPWDDVASRYTPGDIVGGKVTKITGFGVFVELDSGIEGLVHISQVSDKQFENIKDVIAEGDSVKAQVIKLDKAERRIALSIKNFLLGKEFEPRKEAKEAAPVVPQVKDVDTRMKDGLEKLAAAMAQDTPADEVVVAEVVVEPEEKKG